MIKLILLNIFYLAVAFIPIMLLHSFLFYNEMGRKKLIFSLISSLIVIPTIFIIAYNTLLIKNLFFSEDYIFIVILALMGLVAVNYLIFLITKRQKAKDDKKKYFISCAVLLALIYLSIPSFLISIYPMSSLLNEHSDFIKFNKLAVKMSVIPYQKGLMAKETSEDIYYLRVFSHRSSEQLKQETQEAIKYGKMACFILKNENVCNQLISIYMSENMKDEAKETAEEINKNSKFKIIIEPKL